MWLKEILVHVILNICRIFNIRYLDVNITIADRTIRVGVS